MCVNDLDWCAKVIHIDTNLLHEATWADVDYIKLLIKQTLAVEKLGNNLNLNG